MPLVRVAEADSCACAACCCCCAASASLCDFSCCCCAFSTSSCCCNSVILRASSGSVGPSAAQAVWAARHAHATASLNSLLQMRRINCRSGLLGVLLGAWLGVVGLLRCS